MVYSCARGSISWGIVRCLPLATWPPSYGTEDVWPELDT